MKSGSHRFFCFKTMPDQWVSCFVTHCPKELFKVQWKHLNVVFFGRNNDILYILFQSNQRSCLKIVKSAISYKVFNKLACSWILLNFVEDNQ